MSGDKPWIAGNLRIPAAVMAEIEAHALECYPSEACGFVMGPAGEPDLLDEARREENEADKYHAAVIPRRSRARAPCTSRSTSCARSGLFTKRREDSGRPLKVIYHSHCDAGAYFSAEDAATFAQSGQLMWPCAYIVVSVVNGEIADRKLWVHTPGTNGFHASTLTIR
jgi:proteasome lid subunit RPN8/RPN11